MMTGRHANLAFLSYSNTRPAVSMVLDFYFTVLHDCLENEVPQLKTALIRSRQDDETFLYSH